MKSSKITIRKFKNQDASEAAYLVKKALLKVSTLYYPKGVINNLVKEYSAKKLIYRNKNRAFLVATFKNKIVGTVQFTDDGWICGLFIHDDYQKLGIGTKLIRKVKQMAKKKGFSTIRSHVAINSVNFYKKLGFRVVKKVFFKAAGDVYRVIIHL